MLGKLRLENRKNLIYQVCFFFPFVFPLLSTAHRRTMYIIYSIDVEETRKRKTKTELIGDIFTSAGPQQQ